MSNSRCPSTYLHKLSIYTVINFGNTRLSTQIYLHSATFLHRNLPTYTSKINTYLPTLNCLISTIDGFILQVVKYLLHTDTHQSVTHVYLTLTHLATLILQANTIRRPYGCGGRITYKCFTTKITLNPFQKLYCKILFRNVAPSRRPRPCRPSLISK